nr:MAG TPA: hypothetical protein [Caudoviricetes sp.]
MTSTRQLQQAAGFLEKGVDFCLYRIYNICTVKSEVIG